MSSLISKLKAVIQFITSVLQWAENWFYFYFVLFLNLYIFIQGNFHFRVIEIQYTTNFTLFKCTAKWVLTHLCCPIITTFIKLQIIFTITKIFLLSLCGLFSFPVLSITDLISVPVVLLILECYINHRVMYFLGSWAFSLA